VKAEGTGTLNLTYNNTHFAFKTNNSEKGVCGILVSVVFHFISPVPLTSHPSNYPAKKIMCTKGWVFPLSLTSLQI
jgi:hypothetical protein